MKNPDHARFAEWDAAYVLGALSPSDRREFEDHLEDCERCRAAVTELSAMPGLLGRIDDARAFALLENPAEDDATPPATTVETVARIRRIERGRTIRRRLISIGGLAAAAALATALTLAIPALVNQPRQPDAIIPLASATGSAVPIDMTVSATSVGWGTKLDVSCGYLPTASSGYSGALDYSLWVVDDNGTETSVSTWRALPGTYVQLQAATALRLDDIAKVQLRTEDGGQTILNADLHN